MQKTSHLFRVAVCQAALVCAGGTALADGGPPVAGGSQVVGRLTFQCRGGVRVQVTQYPGRARVDFAGQTRTLNLANGQGGVLYQGAGFAWISNGRTASMQDTRSGRVELSGCVQVN